MNEQRVPTSQKCELNRIQSTRFGKFAKPISSRKKHRTLNIIYEYNH